MKKDMGELLQGLASWLDVHQEEFFEDVASLVEIPSICEEGEGGYPYGTACAQALRQMGHLAEKIRVCVAKSRLALRQHPLWKGGKTTWRLGTFGRGPCGRGLA